MSNKELNLKVNIGADTSDFQKGAKQAKQGLKDFEKVTGNALDSIASKFGVNLGQIRQIESAMKGLGSKLSEAGNAGAKAFGGLLQSITPVAGAIAGLGVTAVVASFKALNDEAEAFRKTVAGAVLELQDTAYIDTYKQALHDFHTGIGQDLAQLQSGWKRFWASAGADSKNFLTNFFDGGVGDVAGALVQTFMQGRVASALGEEASRIASQIYETQRTISATLPDIARLEAEIARQKQIAYDTTRSTAERDEALARVRELINQKYELQLKLQRDLSDNMQRMVDLTNSTPEQIDAANQQQVRTIQLEAQQADELRALNRLQGTLTKAKQAEAEAAEKAAAAAKEAAALRQARRDAVAADIAATPLPELDLSGAKPVVEEVPTLVVPVRPEVDMQAIAESIRTAKALYADFAASTGELIGNLVGDLLTGGDAWGNFTNTAISAFGDMAIALGKIAISTGLASEAIKASLVTLEGWGAVAAGVALVALGSAVKTGVRNIAAGNYSAAAGVASSTPTSYNSDYTTNEITVDVTGTLKADGNQLVAVIKNTNNKNSYTG